MTKRDYERAATIVQHFNDCGGAKYMGGVDWFVELFRDDNPRFDEARFRTACEPGANVRARGRKETP